LLRPQGLKIVFTFRNRGGFVKERCISSKNRSFVPESVQISRWFIKEGCTHSEVILYIYIFMSGMKSRRDECEAIHFTAFCLFLLLFFGLFYNYFP
jgi:hypothetical protein